MSKQVAFRVDASEVIGSGHVIRCLSLAEALKVRGWEVRFICRIHDGNMVSHIINSGFQVNLLPKPAIQESPNQFGNDHKAIYQRWLGADKYSDAEQCISLIGSDHIDLLVVDHYGLDVCWESLVRKAVSYLMVIDDLADRPHDCEILLNQNLGSHSKDYAGLVSKSCVKLLGPAYALLRPEFAHKRKDSLARRVKGKLKRILISMGGVDSVNATGKILLALARSPLASQLEIIVVMGAGARWLSHIQTQILTLPLRVELRVSITDMAAEMCNADVSIGAAGGTAWERCCLGLPTILVVQADNQKKGTAALESAGAAYVIERLDEIEKKLPDFLARLTLRDNLMQMQVASARITDGLGVQRVIKSIESILD